MSRRQHTVAAEFEYRGVGLHTGKPARIRVRPGAEDEGIVFRRMDLPGTPTVRAHYSNVVEKPRQTALCAHGVEVQTSEHLVASLAGMGVDNALVEIEGEEVPGADGSAREYVELVAKAGLKAQARERKVLKIRQPVLYSHGGVSLVALPTAKEGLTLSYTMDYAALQQHYTLEVTPERFARDVALARTFCLESEVEALRASGLGKGANRENTLVIGGDGAVQGPLRYPDECVRHKVLDLVGDLALLGAAIDGHVVAVRSGHAANVALARKLGEGMEGKTGKVLGIEAIQRLLPHRYPFLLVDRIIELEPMKRAVGIKNVTINEEFFQGHFPGRPIMPGVLQIEAMAQVGGVLLLSGGNMQNKLAMLLTIDEAKFRRNVVPGDQMVIEAVSVKVRERTGQIQTRILVDGQSVTEAMMKFYVADAAEAGAP